MGRPNAFGALIHKTPSGLPRPRLNPFSVINFRQDALGSFGQALPLFCKG